MSTSGCLASSPPLNSTEPAVVSNQNNIFKNSVNIAPTNSEGLLVGYSCIQVYIVSWWRCLLSAGSPTWQFHHNLMYSFIVTSKLCLFADKQDVYQRPGSREADGHMQIRFLSDKWGPAPAVHVTPRSSGDTCLHGCDKVLPVFHLLSHAVMPPHSLSVYLDVCLYFCVQCCDKHHMCSA